MPPMASSTVVVASSMMVQNRPHGSIQTGVQFKPSAMATTNKVVHSLHLQSKSAVTLVNDRRIEFVRARKQNGMTNLDSNTTTLKDSKPNTELVNVTVIHRVLSWTKAKKVGPGFGNLGNTCFLNATLQCLAYTPSFAQYLLDRDVMQYFGVNVAQSSKTLTKPISQGFDAVRVMTKLLHSVHLPTARVVQPKELVVNIRFISKNFRIGRQEDAHEYFRLLLDSMQRSCLRKAHIKQEATNPLTTTTFIHRMFGGKLKNTLTCAKCKYVSSRYDEFLDLSLEISESGIHSIQKAIQHFTTVEVLDDRNAWKCTKCMQPNRAEKGLVIDSCPNVLVIQLKRFDGLYGKIKKHIEFGLTLDLSIGMCPEIRKSSPKGKYRYELHGVLVHAGYSTNSGHYYSFIKGSSGQWYEMNDDCVRWVNVDTVLEQKAYMLFYSRVLLPSDQPPPPQKKEVEKPQQKVDETTVVGKGETKVQTDKKDVEGLTAKKSISSKEDLNMNGFLASLKTTLPTLAVSEPDLKTERDEMTMLTYTVSTTPQPPTRACALAPVFLGFNGKFGHHRSQWARVPHLHMTSTTTIESAVPSGKELNAMPKNVEPPAAVVRSINPRELRQFGLPNAALFGKSVESWTASTEADSNVDQQLLEKHDQVLKAMKDEDWTYRRAQKKSSWDEELDTGKIKKVKKRTAFVANQGRNNAFQQAHVFKKRKQC